MFRIIVCTVVLMVGFIGMNGLANMKKRPSELSFSEPSLWVEAVSSTAENVTVSIKGFGEVKTLNVVSITPEVSGTVIDIHPKLEAGEVISKGDMIFKIDPRNYQASLQEAAATVRQLEDGILMLKRQLEIDKERLLSLQRNRDIAGQQHERVRKLFDEDRVGTLSGVDQAEQSFFSVSDQATQMARTVELYPIQIRESESSLESARARLSTAGLNLERCEVRAPFTGRVKSVSLEKGQYVSPGKEVVTLADDSVLEIEVSLDSRDAEKWLRFNGKAASGTNAWFDGLEKVDCNVRWTEAASDIFWKGTLNTACKLCAKQGLCQYPPIDAERPMIQKIKIRRTMMTLYLTGDMSEYNPFDGKVC